MIMGRKTYDSFPEPLPSRTHIVVSRSVAAAARTGFILCSSLERAIEEAKTSSRDIFFIGGAEIYEQAIPLVDKMYISYIKGCHDGDTRFPEFNRDDWKIQHVQDYAEFEAVVYVRKDEDPK